jgi:hypothetical protein
MTPPETIRYCNELEAALREYQSIVEGLLRSNEPPPGSADRLKHAFDKVRDAYIPLEHVLSQRTRRVMRNTKEWWELWEDVPTFRGIRTLKDFEAILPPLGRILLSESFSFGNPVYSELLGYFECVDSVRREAQREIKGTKKTDASQNHSTFRHSPDYRSVILCGKQFSLTPQQAQVVEILHEAYENGTPEVGQAYLLEQVATPSSRLRDTFKGSSAWGELIIPGTTQGSFRLNL